EFSDYEPVILDKEEEVIWEEPEEDKAAWEEFTKEARAEFNEARRKARYPESHNAEESSEYEQIGATRYNAAYGSIEETIQDEDGDEARMQDLKAFAEDKDPDEGRKQSYPEAFSSESSQAYEEEHHPNLDATIALAQGLEKARLEANAENRAAALARETAKDLERREDRAAALDDAGTTSTRTRAMLKDFL
ncbi:hypothetical protein HON58_00510, partial [Candidatus Peregrinibacteria bacterium]|nr:hypothetical protein [Candidatus Peregrinibacteria bacterium]